MKRHAAPIAVLAVALALAGCLGSVGDDPAFDREERAVALQEDAVDAMEEVDAYRFETDLTVRVEGEDESGTVSMTLDGAVDEEAERMHVGTELESTSATGSRSEEFETYVLGDEAYVEQFGGWVRQPTAEDPWRETTLAQDRELLESADVRVVGAERVDGTETTVIGLEPEPATLEEYAERDRAGVGGSNAMDVQSATVRQYVANDTNRIVRSELSVTATIDGDHAELELVVTYDGFDEDVTVDVPEDLEGRADGGSSARLPS